MAEYSKSYVYMPDMETILAATQKRYISLKNLIGKIDCLEIFIKTQKHRNSYLV